MIDKLKTSIEQKVGFQIDSVRACRKLEQILYNRGFFVSYTTISRIFSVAKIVSSPRDETLNLLSKFLGYESFIHFSEVKSKLDEMESEYVRHVLKLKSLLLLGQYYEAIDEIDQIKKIAPSKYLYHSQFLGKSIFGNHQRDEKLISYLLNKDFGNLNFQEFFVFEDDPYGHFTWALEHINSTNKSSDRELFENLFILRKNLLNGKKPKSKIEIGNNAHYHLQSRFFEIEILKNEPEFKLDELLSEIIEIVRKLDDNEAKLAYVGRACRGIVYTNNYGICAKNDSWKEVCLSTFNCPIINLEFKAPIYTFLKKAYYETLALDFFINNNWENAIVESQLIISMAFDDIPVIKNYSKFLGIKLQY
jgi:hypothetical protein